MRHYNPYTIVLSMFTGIISSVGTVNSLVRENNIFRLTLKDIDKLDAPAIGSSVAVNGACLTVVENSKDTLVFEVMEETMKRTNLGQLDSGSHVNLEQALLAHGRFEGHMVQGHIDTQARLEGIEEQEGGGKIFRFSLAEQSPFLLEKGSIALNGVSLTLVNVNSIFFTVGIIPHTWKNTNLVDLKIGDKVNVEFDLVLKYLSGLWGSWGSGCPGG